MAPVVKLEKITKTYQNDEVALNILRGIDLTIDTGSFTSIMGPSGSGKSTLLHIIGFLDRPTTGKYFFNGRDTTTLSDKELANIRNKEVGFVFQAFHLLPRMSVIENVMLPLAYSDKPETEHKKLAYEALSRVELGHRVNFQPTKLSGGEKQRGAIARALVNGPKVILADEPTGNLDTKTGAMVMEIFGRLHAQGLTVVLITHDNIIADYAQQTVRIRDGEIFYEERVKNPHRHDEPDDRNETP